MNLLRTLLIFIFSILLLVTLWPLFMIFVLGMILYWMYFRVKFNGMVQRAKEEQSTSVHGSVIDVEVVEREEPHD